MKMTVVDDGCAGNNTGRVHVLCWLSVWTSVSRPSTELRRLQCRPVCAILHSAAVLLLHGLAQGLSQLIPDTMDSSVRAPKL